jgi:glycosyltransferase involved in cell wall biosynthesis
VTAPCETADALDDKIMTITAIITTFRRPEWLVEAIESVLRQSRPVDEILVVDAGTAEETKTAVATFGPSVRYLQMADRGLSASRNFGVQHATGDWVAFLDDDDQWLPEKIKLQEKALKSSPNAVLAYTSQQMFGQDGDTGISTALTPERLWPGLRTKNSIPPSAVMVQKAALLAAGSFNESLRNCEDWDLWVRLAQNGRFVAVLEPVTRYRISAGQMSTNIDLMLSNTEKIMDSSLLLGLRGVSRVLWRRRIRASQLFSAAILARDAGSRESVSFVSRSLWQWPAPAFQPKRFWFLVRELTKAG